MSDTDSAVGDDENRPPANEQPTEDASEKDPDENDASEKDPDEKAALYQHLNDETDVDPDISTGSAQLGGPGGLPD